MDLAGSERLKPYEDGSQQDKAQGSQRRLFDVGDVGCSCNSSSRSRRRGGGVIILIVVLVHSNCV